jgi:hypothetical protein
MNELFLNGLIYVLNSRFPGWWAVSYYWIARGFRNRESC